MYDSKGSSGKKTWGQSHSHGKKITYNGETHTIVEWSEITGIPRTTIQARIKNGWPLDDVLELRPMGCRTTITASIGGHQQTHRLEEWSEITGIPERVLKSRIRCGWNPDRIVTTPYKRSTRGKTYDYNHEKMTITQIASTVVLPYQTLQYRLKVDGAMEKAANVNRQRVKPRVTWGESYPVDGKEYTVAEIAAITGRHPHTIRSRLQRGVNTMEELRQAAKKGRSRKTRNTI